MDSGCSKTIIGEIGWNLLSSLGLSLHNSKLSSKSCLLANGETCQILGTVTLLITVQDRTISLEVLVIPEIRHSLILGIDFWKAMDFVPNFQNGTWTFADANEISAVSTDHLFSRSTISSVEEQSLQSILDSPVLNSSELGCTNLIEHHIRTSAEPIKQRYYPLSPALLKITNTELDSMISLGIVEPSSSPWTSLIVLVKKKDNYYRFCIDYRKVNAVTKKDAYPLPYINTILDCLRDAQYLSSLDIRSAYWQIPLSKDSKLITAFTIPGRGLYQFTHMPFGLHNSPATFQRLIDQILGADLEPYCFAYTSSYLIL